LYMPHLLLNVKALRPENPSNQIKKFELAIPAGRPLIALTQRIYSSPTSFHRANIVRH